MKSKNLAILALVFSGVIPVLVYLGAASKQTPKIPDIHKDVFYVEGSQNPFQQLDLYIPTQGKGPFPVIVWIHGGAWIAGDKNHPPAIQPLTEKGFAVASLNYRLAQHTPHPAQINDCKAAILWLRKHAAEYNLDVTRIGAWGHSAGGHLTALLGTTGDILEFKDDGNIIDPSRSTAVQAAVDWAGPTDFDTIASHQGPNAKLDFSDPHGPVAVLLAGKSPSVRTAAGAVSHLSKDDPPLLLVHGKEDDVVPAEQSVELCDKMKALGMQVDCLIIPSEGHALSTDKAFERTLEFFEKYLLNYQPQPK